MKNGITFTFSIGIIILACFFGVVRAQTEGSASSEEAITSFHSSITVNVDNSIKVVETISYNTGNQERHGIYRDIYSYSSARRKMTIGNVSVTDEKGNPYIFEVYNDGGNIRVKIGDPDQTFIGQKIYIIKYNASKAVAQFEDFDEIYWNVTGNEWNIPIYSASASVALPERTNVLQSSCYYGPRESTNQCDIVDNQGEPYIFHMFSSLSAGEGFTVALGFSKGVVTAYSASDTVSNFFDIYGRWIAAGILPIATLFFSLLYWYKKGRDPKGTGVIVPQYDVPDNLAPMEIAGIVNQKINIDNISAEIIHLATMGYLKINQTEERALGIFKSTDYELVKLKDFSSLSNEFDKKLLEALFKSGSSIVKLSELKNVFYKDANSIIVATADSLLDKGYYKNLGRMKNSFNALFIMLFMSVWASIFLGGLIGSFIFLGNPLPFMLGIFISIIIYSIISYFYPAKTEKGVATKEYILGLKDYLRIAEKDRLLFHNAPESKPEIFEKLLPYAMVLGVVNIWAKEFEGIYNTQPSWYSGSNHNTFSATKLSNSLSNFGSFASSSMSSSPSGSGGGGSSGGGGGGGGGGGW